MTAKTLSRSRQRLSFRIVPWFTSVWVDYPTNKDGGVRLCHFDLCDSIAILLPLLCPISCGDTNLDAPLEKPIALYDESDQVVELFDETINSIHNSEYIWVVEFYAHW